MDIKHLESFVCVARMGSMTAAAQMLYLTVPALAQQINRLEKEAHVPLFHRSPRGMTLTPAGQCFYEDAQKILDMTADMLRRCRNTEQQTENIVRIGSIKGLVPDFYPGIQRAVRSLHPEIRLEHVESTFEELRRELLIGELDMLEFYDSPLASHPNLQYIPLLSEGRNCLLSPDHPLASKERITLEDLIGYPLYVYEFERLPGLAEYVREHCPQVQLLCKKVSPTQSIPVYYAVLDLCESGGVCLITPHCAHRFAPLVTVPLDIPLTWSGGLICSRTLRPQTQTVIDAAKAEFCK